MSRKGDLYKAWLAKNPDKSARYRFDAQLVKACRRAGITVDEYKRALAAQGGVCKLCHQPNRNPRMRRLVIDHDHVTGRFRGLLCSGCNSGLGYFADDAALLFQAIDYLREKTVVEVLPSA